MRRKTLPLLSLLVLGSLSQMAFSNPQQEQSVGETSGFWLLLLAMVVVLVVLAWWALRSTAPQPAAGHGHEEPEHHAPAPAAEAEVVVEAKAEPAAAPAKPAEPAEPDDLRRIEGIGPKVSSALIEMGISTFAQLAKADPEKLEADLKAAGVRIISGAPATWPEQAAFAAKGDWAGFEKLTDSLKGGRRA